MQTQTPTDKAKLRKPSSAERLAQEITDLRERSKLDSWTSFVEELTVPAELYPAVMANRAALVKAAVPRDMSKDEVAVLFKLIAGLIETNQALREHTERVAQLTSNLNGQIVGFHRVAQQIEDFANFRNAEPTDEPEGDGP